MQLWKVQKLRNSDGVGFGRVYLVFMNKGLPHSDYPKLVEKFYKELEERVRTSDQWELEEDDQDWSLSYQYIGFDHNYVGVL